MRKALDLRPLSFGETLGRSFSLFTGNLLGYSRWMLLVYLLPVLGMMTWLYFVLEPYEWANRPGADPSIFDFETGYAQYFWLVNLFSFALSTTVVAAGIYFLSARLYVGAVPSLAELFRALKTRLPHLAGVGLLHLGCCLGLGLGAYGIPLVMGQSGDEVSAWMLAILVCTPGLVLVLAWYLGRWGLNRAAVMLDDAQTTDAFQRSSYLTERFRWRLFGLTVVVMLLVTSPVGPGLLAAPGYIAKGLATDQGWHLAADVLMVTWGALLLPVFYIAPVVYYFDMRCRKESYDLAVMARNFGIDEAEMLRHRMNPGMGYYPAGYTGDRSRRERKPATRRMAQSVPGMGAQAGFGPQQAGMFAPQHPQWPQQGVPQPQPQWQRPGMMPPQQPQWPQPGMMPPQPQQRPQWPAPGMRPQQPQWPQSGMPTQQPQWPAPGPNPSAPPLPKWRPPTQGPRS